MLHLTIDVGRFPVWMPGPGTAQDPEHPLEFVDPDPCGMDRLLRADSKRAAGLKITNVDAGVAVRLTQEADQPDAGGYGRPVMGRGAPIIMVCRASKTKAKLRCSR